MRSQPSPEAAAPISVGSDVYVLPVEDVYLLYSPLRNCLALVEWNAVARLQKELSGSCAQGALPVVLQAFCTPVAPPPMPDGPARPEFLGLLPTRGCNIACAYCNFGSGPAGGSMDPAVATVAIDWMAGHVCRQGRDVLDIHFFGGEPFVARDIVEIAVHHARLRARESGLVPHLEVSTNGVLDEASVEFAGDYFDAVVLSCDGMREMQDRQRPARNGGGTFEAVLRTAQALSRAPAKLCIRCCVTSQSVALMEETGRWFCEVLQPAVINFETLRPTDESTAAGLAPPDPYVFARQWERTRAIVERHGIEAVYAAAVVDTPVNSFCPLGRDSLIVAPDGTIVSCYLPPAEWEACGLDLAVGAFGADGTVRIDQRSMQRVRRLAVDKSGCRTCFCRWHCAGGCHVRRACAAGGSGRDAFCLQTRVITACRLLGRLGCAGRAARLLDRHLSMQCLAENGSDLIEDWRHESV